MRDAGGAPAAASPFSTANRIVVDPPLLSRLAAVRSSDRRPFSALALFPGPRCGHAGGGGQQTGVRGLFLPRKNDLGLQASVTAGFEMPPASIVCDNS